MAEKTKPTAPKGGGALATQNKALAAMVTSASSQRNSLAKQNASLAERAKAAARRATLERKDKHKMLGAVAGGAVGGITEALADARWDWYHNAKSAAESQGKLAARRAYFEGAFALIEAIPVALLADGMNSEAMAGGADGLLAVAASRFGQGLTLSMAVETSAAPTFLQTTAPGKRPEIKGDGIEGDDYVAGDEIEGE